MSIRTALGGLNFLEGDVKDESSRISKLGTKLAKAKSKGAGIGGMLGMIIGNIVLPGIGGAIGGYFGSKGGSLHGGNMSGVREDDIHGGRLLKQTQLDVMEDITEKSEADALQAGITGFMQAGNVTKGWDLFQTGMKTAKAKDIGLIGQLLGGAEEVGRSFVSDIFDPLKASKVDDSGVDTSAGSNKTKKIELGSFGDMVGGLYTKADERLGGLLPYGQPFSEGYINKYVGKPITTLASDLYKEAELPEGWQDYRYGGDKWGQERPKEGQQDLTLSKEFLSQAKNRVSANQGLLDNYNPNDSNWVKQFQMQFMGMNQGAPGFGTLTPETAAMFQAINKSRK